MSSALADLETALQGMLSLKPPGVSGSRIQGITTLCTSNVQSESVLIQKLYTHFRKAPGTHKLGVLYVVDSVTRKWTEQAKNAGQPINNDAQDGTFAAGVNRVKELLPALMNDIIHSAPDDQKEKIRKLIEIWEKGQTFPMEMLTQFKDKLNAPPSTQTLSTTPPGSPPAHIQQNAAPPAASVVPQNSSILAALANLARQNSAAAAAPPAPAPVPQPPAQLQPQPMDNIYNMAPQGNPVPQLQSTGAMNLHQYASAPPPVNVPVQAAPYASQPQGPAVQNFASNLSNPYAAPPPVVPQPGLDPAMQQQLMIIKALADQGFPPDKIAGIMAAMGQGVGGVAPSAQYPPQNQNQNPLNAQNQNGWGESRERNGNGYHEREAARSPQYGRFRQRSRSRSPPRGWNSHGSPATHRRDENRFEHDRDQDSPGRNRGSGRGRGNEYRQRSPPRRRSPSPPQTSTGGAKWVGHDPTMPKGNIKVLSRTLFVGGVTMPDHELRRIFDSFGQVQTCIVNKDKRHAFVKMVSRQDAVNAKDEMEKNRTPDSQLRTRWGVGFGPRDCSDYTTGVSVIPIAKLTDADRKWMLNAEYGGSGGKPIESGMVVEEPDIEIGQGVSSKAISRRMQTDLGGNKGPKNTRDQDEDEFGRVRRRGNNGRDGGKNHFGNNGGANEGPASMPAIPPFGAFPGMGMPGMPGFTTGGAGGYSFPGQAPRR
ncbi:hypothetical protein HYALB_00000207 [Hymenoscyphus albidus]|uniref:NRD1 protein n=1 Tax=Hymenoscyphus albidus TaxID=595503 RepID=A0A9N9PY36_9HELO|nr:hypothetical protein HYALB_00000207 [Hymenoscyphus albidus]